MLDVKPLSVPDLLLVTPRRFGDPRGWFSQTWNRADFAEAGIEADFIQDNHAFSAQAHTLRGLHFQTGEFAQAKLLRVTRGAIFDVAVDIRPGSLTYGRWAGAELSAENGAQLFVPRGFAHGYLTLTPDCEVLYKVDNDYAPQAEGGLSFSDPEVGIDWGVSLDQVTANDRDRAWPLLKDL